jgi:putative intracellular protease/amidase
MYFADQVTWLSPGARSVHSLGGLTVQVDGAFERFDAKQADALVLIGSPTWEEKNAPDFSTVICDSVAAEIVVAGICGATIALARSGVLNERAHTSNGVDYLPKHAASYRGAAHYRDVPRVVRDGKLVTAAGSSPANFAVEVLELLHPNAKDQLSAFRNLLALEHLQKC